MEREQRILEAAEKLFFERSFDGVGVDAIGKEAGITGSAIYRHFSSKDEILAALFDQATDALLVSVGLPVDDPGEELIRLTHAHIEFTITHQRLAGIFQREQATLRSAHERSFRRRQQRYIERWVKCLEKCYPGHSRAVLLATIRAMHALITSDCARPSGSKRVPELPALLTNLALSSLEALGRPTSELPTRWEHSAD